MIKEEQLCLVLRERAGRIDVKEARRPPDGWPDIISADRTLQQGGERK
jgi:hypothetical protein